jgi:polysaccharide export outer membrane protein
VFALAALAALIAPGCSGMEKHRRRHTPQLGGYDLNQPRELQMVSHPMHVVEPPDELEISVRPEELRFTTQQVVVRPDGNIDLGFDGDVYVSGLTLDEVELKIASQLAATRKHRGPITVAARLVDGTKSKSYYVVGAVANQGKFPLTGKETVLDGILQAGLRSNSYPEKAYLSRPHPAGGPDTILKIDWFGIRDRADTTTNYQLLPGDRLVVPGGKPPSPIAALLGGG